ncbi:MAG: aminomethyltransferase family protein [Nitrospinota bacterium]|nr:aminomethyltransferase family protein [Nitrospinota bacterium]
MKRGAVMSAWDGWELPAHYGDPLAEYWAARSGVIRTDRSHRTQLRLVGEDRLKFLQNILSNEVASLPPGRGAYAALLTATGKMVADFRGAILSESVLLDAEARCRESAFSHLDMFNLGYDCEITDETEDFGMVTLAGPKSREAVREALGQGPDLDKNYECVEFDWEGARTIMAATDRLGPPAIDLIVPAGNLPPLWDAFEAVPPSGFSALEALRIEAGAPRFGADMDESVNPMEAGLLNALDFDKGCYVGQEVVAKIESLGHVNRSLVALHIEGDTPPETGAAIFEDGKKVGHVTSAARSPALEEVVALGYVHRRASTPGQALETDCGETRVAAVVGERPPASGN